MKRLLLMMLLVATVLLPVAAQQRTEAEAKAIAKAFMQKNGYDINITKSAKINKVRTEKAGEITPYFIFNDTQNGGFVIVGGQEGMSDILAYSNEDCFDTENTPPAAQHWLDIYAQSAIKAAENPEEAKAQKRAAAKAFLKSNFALRQNVQPLLGEIKYNQGEPYNYMCPMLTETKIENGDTIPRTALPVTGCTQTAQAMLMRYWKHPVRPTGSKTYTFGYDSIKNKDVLDKNGKETITVGHYTLSIDFDKEPDYDWDNMLPRYESVKRTDDAALRARQDTAVARLMLHLGISNGAGYGHGGTGAGLDISEMIKYFDYSPDYKSDSYSNYKDLGDDAYRAMLADELSQGRPIWAAGSQPGGAHSYICDGFDLNALFHFNLGWNGGSNGWYEVAPVPQVPYGQGMWFHRHIHPNGRLTPTEPTRRIVFEAGYGDWNKKSTSIKNTFKAVDTDNKFGETMICIATGFTEEDAENYNPGLSTIKGILINRHDTITGTISADSLTPAYERNAKIAAPALIDIDAMYASDSTIIANVSTQFPYEHADADYKISLVFTEDNVRYNGVAYNYIVRGYYTFDDCFPATIEADKQYIYEKEVPIPATVKATNNITLVAMLIDGKTGNIVNANTVDFKQINTWKANNKAEFHYEGENLGESSTITTYNFNEEKNRMEVPLRINNPWFQRMAIDVTAEAVELAENAEIQLGETVGAISQSYYLNQHVVDSTMMLYLNISDKYTSSTSSVKVIVKQNKKKVTEQIINFEFIKNAEGTNPYSVRIKGTLEDLVSKEVKDTITTITLSGRLCGNDFIYLRDSLPNLSVIDMRDARIVEGPGVYYGNDYVTSYDIVGTRLFESMNVKKIILPESATKIDNYAFNSNKTITEVVIGNNVKSIGNSAFYKCLSMNNITIPASVTSIGRQAFKDTPLTCVTCESETPATLSLQVFSGVDLANATLMVPGEAAVEAYKAAKQWKDFGNIVAYTPTEIADVTEEASVSVKAGKIVVANDAAVAIYTFTGKLVATGAAGEYALPAGNYIVKVGNKAVKVKL